MPTLRVPSLNITMPMDELEVDDVFELGPERAAGVARGALARWLGGATITSVGPATWDPARKRWTGAISYLGAEHPWVMW